MGVLGASVDDLFGYTKLQELLLVIIARINEQDETLQRFASDGIAVNSRLDAMAGRFELAEGALERLGAALEAHEAALHGLAHEEGARKLDGRLAALEAASRDLQASVAELAARRPGPPPLESLDTALEVLQRELLAGLEELRARQEASESNATVSREHRKSDAQDLGARAALERRLAALEDVHDLGARAALESRLAALEDAAKHSAGLAEKVAGLADTARLREDLAEKVPALANTVCLREDRLAPDDEALSKLARSMEAMCAKSDASAQAAADAADELAGRIIAVEAHMGERLPTLERAVRKLATRLDEVRDAVDLLAAASSAGARGDLEEQLVDLRSEVEERLAASEAAAEGALGMTDRLKAFEGLELGRRGEAERFERMLEAVRRELERMKASMQNLLEQRSAATSRCISCFDIKFQEENNWVAGTDGRVYLHRRPSTPPRDADLESDPRGKLSPLLQPPGWHTVTREKTPEATVVASTRPSTPGGNTRPSTAAQRALDLSRHSKSLPGLPRCPDVAAVSVDIR